jgi:hypothetical protein
MADLRQTSSNSGIDGVGWLFVAVTVAIIAVAAVIAYEGNGTNLADPSIPHLVAR